MKSCALAARAAATRSASRGVGAAETQVVLDRAVEQVGVLRHHGDHPAHRLGIERAQVVAADADRAALRIVQAEQQADDGGFAGAAGADDADALAGGDAEATGPDARRAGRRGRRSPRRRRRCCGRRTATRVHAGRRSPPVRCGRRGDRLVQQRVDAGRRRLAGQALVQHGAQLAQRAEDFRAGHQHDQQRLQAHLAVADPVRAERQRRRRRRRRMPRSVMPRVRMLVPSTRTCCRTARAPCRPASGRRRRSGRTPSASAGPASRRGTPRRMP